MKKGIRWILTPLAFPIGLFVGHCFALINVIFPISMIGLFFIWLMCGACSAVGSILLPTWVAPSHKLTVGKIAFWIQVVVFILSIVTAIYASSLEGRELVKYIVSMVGSAGGIIYCKLTMEEYLE